MEKKASQKRTNKDEISFTVNFFSTNPQFRVTLLVIMRTVNGAGLVMCSCPLSVTRDKGKKLVSISTTPSSEGKTFVLAPLVVVLAAARVSVPRGAGGGGGGGC